MAPARKNASIRIGSIHPTALPARYNSLPDRFDTIHLLPGLTSGFRTRLATPQNVFCTLHVHDTLTGVTIVGDSALWGAVSAVDVYCGARVGRVMG